MGKDISHELEIDIASQTSTTRWSVITQWLARPLGFFKGNHLALVGGIISLFFILVAIFGPALAPFDPVEQTLLDRLQGPSMVHPLGTDELGRDLASRLIYGARISIMVGLVGVGIAFVVGVAIGVMSGYWGSWVDTILMRLIDILLTIPSLLLTIAMITVLGTGMTNLMMAIGLTRIPAFARLVRGTVLAAKEFDYVLAARSIGVPNRLIMIRHLLPNAIGPIVVLATLDIGGAIIGTATLGFLGLGVQPPTPEWGTMLSRGRAYTAVAPHVVAFPGLAIALLVLGFNMFGDGLRDALDPRLKRIR